MSRARGARDDGNLPLAEALYRTFLERYAHDPLVPVAHLELGRLLLKRGEVTEARGYFKAVSLHQDPAVAEQGHFYGAVADFRQGHAAQAADILRPMVGRTIDPEDTSLLLATLAEAELSLGRVVPAIVALDKLAGEAVANESRAAALERLAEVIGARASASEIDDLLRVLPEDGPGYSRAVRRAVRDAQAANDVQRTRELIDQMKAAGMPLDDEFQEIAVRASRPGDADPQSVGAILSLSGRARQVGELALRGLMLAAGVPADGPQPAGSPRLVFRDDGGDPDRASRAVDELVSVHRVVAIVGPMDGRTARAAAERAEEVGVPLIALTPTTNLPNERDHVFQIFPTARAEVAALVAQARQEGHRRFAIMRPASSFGDTMQAVFDDAVERLGGERVAAQTYAQDATAFGREVAGIAARRPDALLVADAANRLALIAPALAAAGLWSGGPSGEAPKDGRLVQVLAPSVAFDHNMANKGARYLQGALFAVPFDATTAEGAGRSFVDKYEAQFGSSPTTFAALAHDAYILVKAATDQGANSRSEVRDGLSSVRMTNLAGAATGFDRDGSPNVPARLLRFSGDAFTPVASPAALP